MLGKKLGAEFIGTFVLVLFACGAAVYGDGMTLGIAFAFGLVIIAMAYSIGTVSGCHINPAVSLAMLVNGRMSMNEFLGYVCAQVLGAIAGSGVMAMINAFMQIGNAKMGQNFYGDVGMVGAFIVEVILTFVFVLTIVAVTGKKGNANLAGLVIGFALVLVHLLGIPLTGTSVNPARSIGPAIFAGGQALAELWVFIAAPLVGGALAAVVGKSLLGTESK